jgi:hypothetical protein
MKAWLRDIQIRATERIGELSRDLDKVDPTSSRDPKSGRLVPTGGKKAKALVDAGISKSAAH